MPKNPGDKSLTDVEIKKALEALPPEVKTALEKELLGSTKVAVNILKAIKERWQIGEWDGGGWPEDRSFDPAPDADVTKVIDSVLEKEGLI